MCFVEEEMVWCYYNKLLVLVDEEENSLQFVILVWCKMGKVYVLCVCFEELDYENFQYVVLMVILLYCCFYYIGMIIFEYFCVCWELLQGIWLDLYGYYEMVEEWGVVFMLVEDVLENILQVIYCVVVYVMFLLIDIVSFYSISVCNFNLIRCWVGMWVLMILIYIFENDFEEFFYIVELVKDMFLYYL